MIEVFLERAASGGRQLVVGARRAAREGLGARHVSRFLEFARVDAEVAVRRIERRFQIGKRQFFAGGEGADDAPRDSATSRTADALVRLLPGVHW